MEDHKDIKRILDLMPQPVFCVRDGAILYRNHGAKQLYLEPGLPVAELLGDALQDYQESDGSSLYLQLTLPGIALGACVYRLEDMDIFVADQNHSELQALSVAATQLREPLSDVLSIVNQMGDDIDRSSRGQLTQRLFQLQRMIFNMSDAARYSARSAARQSYQDICGVVEELFRRIEDLAARSGITLVHSCPRERVMTLLTAEKLERAVYNLISNAMKVTPKGGTIEAKLTYANKRLYLSVRDFGSGIAPEVMGSLYTRYLRQPGLETNREGIGLGMTLIRATATEHGGAVLIDHPDGVGTRVTMTLSVRTETESLLRSRGLPFDYAGEQDHGLVELADLLPLEIYTKDI